MTVETGGPLRRGLRSLLQRARDRLVSPPPETHAPEPSEAPVEPPPVRSHADAQSPVAPRPLEVQAAELTAEDVRLEAFQVLHKQGVGWELAFVDVREPHEVAASGVIPGALRLPLGALEARWREVPQAVTVIVYCASGQRSTRAALRLRALGHPDAWSLDRGLQAWVREGGEVEPA